jgi:hypothetical protein
MYRREGIGEWRGTSPEKICQIVGRMDCFGLFLISSFGFPLLCRSYDIPRPSEIVSPLKALSLTPLFVRESGRNYTVSFPHKTIKIFEG